MMSKEILDNNISQEDIEMSTISYIGIQGTQYGKFTEVTDKNGNVTTTFSPYGRLAKLIKVYHCIEDDTYKLELGFSYGNDKRTLIIDRGELTDKTACKKLADNGVSVKARTFEAFADSINLQEEAYLTNNNPKYYSYCNLGWIETPIIDSSGKPKLCYRASQIITDTHLSSEYTGNFKVTPMGSIDTWIDMVRKDVLPHTPLSIVLLCALSAVVAALLSFKYPLGNGIYHLCAVSSAGKTTAAFLAASISGQPFTVVKEEYDKNGRFKQYSSILQSFAATDNALIGKLSGNCGVPIVLDEIGKHRGTDLTETVFNLFDGNGISRMDSELKVTEKAGFRGTIITVGETSIFDKCSKKLEGLHNRVFKMTSKLTVSADHSNRIKKCCIDNNGMVAPRLANHIMKNGGFEYISEKYECWIQKLTQLLPKVPFVDKFIENFAAIYLTTAEISKDALNLEFDIQAITDYLTAYLDDENNSMDVSKESYEMLMDEFAVHSNNFYCNDNSNEISTHGEVWGKYAKCNKHTASGRRIVGEYLVRKKIVKDLLKAKNYVLEQCKKSWEDNEQISRDKDRPTRSRLIEIGKKPEDVFVFNVFEDKEDSNDEQSRIA